MTKNELDGSLSTESGYNTDSSNCETLAAEFPVTYYSASAVSEQSTTVSYPSYANALTLNIPDQGVVSDFLVFWSYQIGLDVVDQFWYGRAFDNTAGLTIGFASRNTEKDRSSGYTGVSGFKFYDNIPAGPRSISIQFARSANTAYIRNTYIMAIRLDNVLVQGKDYGGTVDGTGAWTGSWAAASSTLTIPGSTNPGNYMFLGYLESNPKGDKNGMYMRINAAGVYFPPLTSTDTYLGRKPKDVNAQPAFIEGGTASYSSNVQLRVEEKAVTVSSTFRRARVFYLHLDSFGVKGTDWWSTSSQPETYVSTGVPTVKQTLTFTPSIPGGTGNYIFMGLGALGHSNKKLPRQYFRDVTAGMNYWQDWAIPQDSNIGYHGFGAMWHKTLTNGVQQQYSHWFEDAGGFGVGVKGSTLLVIPLKVKTMSYNITLNQGWNLVSLPLVQHDESVTSVLSSINGQWDKVYTYATTDAQNPWKSYIVGRPAELNELSALNHRQGIWIHITAATTKLVVKGYDPPTTAIDLYAGWNLVGYPTLDTTKTVATGLWGTGADKVDVWDGGSPYLIKEVGPTQTMLPGHGYWVHVPADTIWTVDW